MANVGNHSRNIGGSKKLSSCPTESIPKDDRAPQQVLHDCNPSPGSPNRNMMLLRYPSPQHLNGFRAKISTRTRAPLEAQQNCIWCTAWENQSQQMNSKLLQKASDLPASLLGAASIGQAQGWRNSLSRAMSPLQGLQTACTMEGALSKLLVRDRV